MTGTAARHLLTLALLLAVAGAPAQASSTIGVIEASLNGELTTWHVRSGGDVPGATLMESAPGRYTAVIAGFESGHGRSDREPHGSQMTISFDFAEGDERLVHELPYEGEAPASVRLMPATDDFTTMHSLVRGRIVVEEVAVSNGRITGFRGTFSGTLEAADGEAPGELTDGTFRVDELQLAEPDRR